MNHDIVSDLLTRIRNAQSVKKREVSVIKSRHCLDILEVMQQEGLIRGFEVSGSQNVKILLKYSRGILPAMASLERVSRPGRRLYVQSKSLWKLNKGLGLYILSTPKGVLVDRDARKLNVGGEVLCKII